MFGIAFVAIIDSGGLQAVFAGGTSYRAEVLEGATEVTSLGGFTQLGNVEGGGLLQVAHFASSFSTTVNSGGVLDLRGRADETVLLGRGGLLRRPGRGRRDVRRHRGPERLIRRRRRGRKRRRR
ncbi:MAG TPA: hypothetical protein VFE13_08680, partial [Caulobacteraceae bacterium]|nr:hypothetical protein [Caulobacteraceae bacterium]